jgi:hypothetical protein
MLSISMLVCDGKPSRELDGFMKVGSVVVREIQEQFPAQQFLYLALFVSRTPPFRDFELLTEIVDPDGNVLDASRKMAPLSGTWDFATLSINLGHVYFQIEGAYSFNLYVREQGQEEWPDEPFCFWSLYALSKKSQDRSSIGTGRDGIAPRPSP